MYSKFYASQAVELEVPQRPYPISDYLRQPQQVVRALGDSSQVEPIGKDVYRLKMKPLKFFMLQIEPIVDLKIWAQQDGTLCLRSIDCQLRGIDLKNHFQLQVSGYTTPCTKNGQTYLSGGAELGLKMYLPPPISFFPKATIQSAGNSLLKSILLRMKQSMMHKLIANYSNWAIDRDQELAAA
ncbi:DUF1997 domain-containing protein [Geitlerinema sp. PCC 9228]|jgi:hypothetical protein|uniref:DUF1997 domain-containing protein n=1 Tax=Geitlerinema sp. PCC 9228 TaxID=111611 RepID=UPI0008F98F31|nr:DUF1997 domain-containing protein [Geitlerinema sp. PCC 9228]